MKAFKDVEALYADDERRRYSGESDYGVWWKSRGVAPQLHVGSSPAMTTIRGGKGNYRVTWIHDTGEFYVVEAGTEKVWLTDAVLKTEEAADAFIEGWAENVFAGKAYIEDQFSELAGRC